jgi:putative spermidine/putrescine transport system ATP-binding protein
VKAYPPARALSAGTEVTFSDVAKRYGAAIALEPTNLIVQAGEFFALLGPSGSGKTTLLGITAGFIPPSQGSVLAGGEDITRLPPERRNIGMVFQSYSLFPFLTVAQNVAFPLEARRWQKAAIVARVSQMLAMVRLSHVAERQPGQLSGGQQQRVALARAAAYNPTLLLMDEPLGALDKNLREEMQDEIRQFHARIGATIIYVTHDQQEAAAMADRTAILNYGRVVQCGVQSDLYEAPGNAFVAGFLGEANLLEVAHHEHTAGQDYVGTKSGVTVAIRPLARDESSRMVVCIRPECVRLSPLPSGCRNSFEGTVTEATHTGGTIRYRIRLRGGVVMTSRSSSQRDAARFQVGDSVFLGFDPSDALMIPE